MQNLPDNAQRVFKGVIFDVWQWPQKMFDGSTQTFEAIQRPDTVWTIPVVGKKILVEKQHQPDSPHAFFSMPGGRLDPGETPLAAAQRELREETGYTSNDWQFWQKLTPLRKTIWSVHCFIARNCSKNSAAAPDAGEKIEYQLLDFEHFLLLSDEESFAWELRPFLFHMRLNAQKKSAFKKLLGL